MITAAWRTHVGLRRALNEDAVLVQPERGLFAVCDGMGGHDHGEIASAAIVAALAEVDLAPPRAAAMLNISHAVAATHAALRRKAGDGVIGSTLAGLRLDAGRYDVFWAGDSRVYRYAAGRLVQLTEDHTLVQRMVRQGELSPDDAIDHPQGHILTRAVGSGESVTLDYEAGRCEAGDVFLLASDGLFRGVEARQVAAALDPDDLEASAERMLNLALAAGGLDNISVVLARPALRV